MDYIKFFLSQMDKDKDGLISFLEFMDETKSSDFDKDEDWKPLTEQDQFTEEELREYEKMLAENPHVVSFRYLFFPSF